MGTPRAGRPPATTADSPFVVARTTVATLRDGSRALVRPVVPADRDELVAGLARLSPRSRYRRFFTALDRLSESQIVGLTEIDYVDHFAWAAFAADEPGLPGVGVGRYIRLRDDPEAADLGLAVVDDWQGRGLGAVLLDGLVAAACENGIRRFVAHVLRENMAMLGALTRHRPVLSRDEPGVVRVEVDVPASAAALRDAPLYVLLRDAACQLPGTSS